MKFIDPRLEKLSVIYNDITYEYEYYKTATLVTGVVDEAHVNWTVGATYAKGDYVIVPELKRIYRSTDDANIGNFPLEVDTTQWVDYGTINSNRMFSSDSDIGSKTEGSDGVFEFDFSTSSAIAGLDLDFSSAEVLQIKTDGIEYRSDYEPGTTYTIDDGVIYDNKLWISLVASNTGNTPDINQSEWEQNTDRIFFDETILGSDIACSTYGEYFYTSAKKQTRKILTGLEWLPESIFRIKFTGGFKIGTICYNTLEEFGATIVGSNLRYESTSKIATNEFTGFRTVLRYGKVRLLDVAVLFDRDLFGSTAQKVDNLIDKNIIWIPTEEDTFTEAISIGYIEELSLPMTNGEKFDTSARIVGVSK